jgi:hypothetical protein
MTPRLFDVDPQLLPTSDDKHKIRTTQVHDNTLGQAGGRQAQDVDPQLLPTSDDTAQDTHTTSATTNTRGQAGGRRKVNSIFRILDPDL